MLHKKFLSLSLAASLAVSASVNTFADGGQSEVAPLPSATEYSKEISENDIITLILIPMCADILSNTIQPFIHLPKVLGLYQQIQELQKEFRQELKQEVLKHNPKVTQLATTFLDLYNDKIHPEFKEAVDKAWVTDTMGSKKHASIGVNKMTKKTRIKKHKTGHQ